MRQIKKIDEPEEFTRWKRRGGRGLTYRDLGQNHEIKDSVRASLIKEQYQLCCYCEDKLIDGNYHIDHFKPQSYAPELQLDYNNMHASCNGGNHSSIRHCGHKKENWYDSNLLISPLSDSTRTSFTFSEDGKMHPQNPYDDSAKTTINKLGLNVEKLKSLRQSAIAAALYFLESELEDSEDYVEDTKRIIAEFEESLYNGTSQCFISSILNVLYRELEDFTE